MGRHFEGASFAVWIWLGSPGGRKRYALYDSDRFARGTVRPQRKTPRGAQPQWWQDLEVSEQRPPSIRCLRPHSARGDVLRRPRPRGRLLRHNGWNFVSLAGCGRFVARSLRTSAADLFGDCCVALKTLGCPGWPDRVSAITLYRY